MTGEPVAPAKPTTDSGDGALAKAMRSFVADIGPTAALAMDACVHCGRCAEACHFYAQTDDPRYTPIHKIEPLKQAYARELGPFALGYRMLGLRAKTTAEELEKWQELLYDSCNMCGRCSLICPMGIDIADLVEKSRHGMFMAGLAPQDFLGSLDAKEEVTGNPFGLTTAKLTEMLHGIGTQYGVAMRVDEPTADIVATVSSIDVKMYPSSMAAIARILNHMGTSWTFLTDGFDADNVSLTAGDQAGQRKITLGIVRAALACGAKTLLMPECGHSYTEMRWEAANTFGKELPFQILQITELLAEGLSSGLIRVNTVSQSATYHDACQLSRRGGATAAPRIILSALGVDLHELKDSGDTSWCCGGGGGVALIKRAQPLRDMAFQIKQRQIDATGVEIIYTSCSGCRQTLEHGGKAAKWDKTVASLLELVASNLQAKA